ncbi:MAG: hypothetical protein R6U51_12355 [Anaerolineales bacterium]
MVDDRDERATEITPTQDVDPGAFAMQLLPANSSRFSIAIISLTVLQ